METPTIPELSRGMKHIGKEYQLMISGLETQNLTESPEEIRPLGRKQVTPFMMRGEVEYDAEAYDMKRIELEGEAELLRHLHL